MMLTLQRHFYQAPPYKVSQQDLNYFSEYYSFLFLRPSCPGSVTTAPLKPNPGLRPVAAFGYILFRVPDPLALLNNV